MIIPMWIEDRFDGIHYSVYSPIYWAFSTDEPEVSVTEKVSKGQNLVKWGKIQTLKINCKI